MPILNLSGGILKINGLLQIFAEKFNLPFLFVYICNFVITNIFFEYMNLSQRGIFAFNAALQWYLAALGRLAPNTYHVLFSHISEHFKKRFGRRFQSENLTGSISRCRRTAALETVRLPHLKSDINVKLQGQQFAANIHSDHLRQN